MGNNQPVFLLIIKATDDPEEEYLPTPDYNEDARVENIRYLLVKRDYQTILDCSYNEKSFKEISTFSK